MSFKSGFIAIIGRPNVGKSSILNQIFESKIAIVSDKVQTTRNPIRGILNEEDAQMVFIDTPGIHEPKDELGKELNRESFAQLEGIDLIFFVIDGSERFGPQDQRILDRIKGGETPIILVVNKIDKLSKSKLLAKLSELNELHNFAAIIPVSAVEKDNLNTLLNVAKTYLPDDVAYFSTEGKSSVDYERSFLFSELIREKVLHFTHDEIPHDVAIVIENLEESEDEIFIQALLLVQKASQKPIVLGKQGQMIKKIRLAAQRSIRASQNKKCTLELFVRVEKDWRTKKSKIEDLGYGNQ